MLIIKIEIYEIEGAITYIKFSGDYENFDELKNNTKEIVRHKGTIKYLTNKCEITTEEDVENDTDLLKIYEGNIKDWNLLITILIDIRFGLVRQ